MLEVEAPITGKDLHSRLFLNLLTAIPSVQFVETSTDNTYVLLWCCLASLS